MLQPDGKELSLNLPRNVDFPLPKTGSHRTCEARGDWIQPSFRKTTLDHEETGPEEQETKTEKPV